MEHHNTTHGHSSRLEGRTRTFRSWEAMKQRCTNPNHSRYANYGGRGITYDPRWEVFENFLADMGECPDGLTLERERVNENYYKGNCRWATQLEQQNNRTNNCMITWNGKTQSASQWERELGWSRCLAQRINRLGWSVEKAMTVAPKLGNNGARHG